MPTHSLFDPISLGGLELRNRIVMAPMTRSRATQDHTPIELMAEYYQQRAGAGLIITEGTAPSPDGEGYPRTPGIYTPEQCAGWKKITQAVHEAGGKIFLQIMHVGRIAQSLNKAANAKTVSASAIRAAGQMFTDKAGMQEMDMPRALETSEIPSVIADYKKATENAFQSGFDGVELHCANGYLPNQFLASGTNMRTDQYGGSVENRIRFVLELLDAMIAIQGPEKIGIRISPGGTFNDMSDANPVETYSTLLKALNPLKLAYVHTLRSPDKNIDAFKLVRDHYQGLSMINGGFTEITGEEAIASGLADLVSFGTSFLANPDLVERFKKHAALNKPNPATFYTPGNTGYTDYPTMP
jgi:N-ethylmaleimide reductase